MDTTSYMVTHFNTGYRDEVSLKNKQMFVAKVSFTVVKVE